jgi:hypothetical protein
MKERKTSTPKAPARSSDESSNTVPNRVPLANDNHELQIELLETQLRLLETRDFAIGAAARSGEMQLRLDTMSAANRDLNVHIENHLAHIERLKTALAARTAQLDLVYASTTWRIGKMMMLPVRLIRRVLKRS